MTASLGRKNLNQLILMISEYMHVALPYSYAHIGNARMSVVTDLLVRVLKTIYENVKFVSNITDIDDKIIEASRVSGKKNSRYYR